MDASLIPSRFADVSPSDSTVLSQYTLGLFIGTAGVLKVKGWDGVTATFNPVAGQVLPGQFKQVLSTGTTASGIVALYR